MQVFQILYISLRYLENSFILSLIRFQNDLIQRARQRIIWEGMFERQKKISSLCEILSFIRFQNDLILRARQRMTWDRIFWKQKRIASLCEISKVAPAFYSEFLLVRNCRLIPFLGISSLMDQRRKSAPVLRSSLDIYVSLRLLNTFTAFQQKFIQSISQFSFCIVDISIVLRS